MNQIYLIQMIRIQPPEDLIRIFGSDYDKEEDDLEIPAFLRRQKN